MLEKKNIGKPYAGKPLVRFDEGELLKHYIHRVLAAPYSIYILHTLNKWGQMTFFLGRPFFADFYSSAV